VKKGETWVFDNLRMSYKKICLLFFWSSFIGLCNSTACFFST
jgi:hypothetical protein